MGSAFPYVTTADTAAASKDLTVKATVFAELGITPTSAQNTLMDTIIHQVSAAIVGYCNREIASEKVLSKFRDLPSGVDTLWLPRVPVTTVHTVVEDGTTLTSAQYELNADSGELWRLDSSSECTTWAAGSLITVLHTGGYVTLTALPHDIERAAIEQCKAQWGGAKRDPTVRSINIPDVVATQFSVGGGDSVGSSGLLTTVEGLLNPYRRVVIA